MREFSTPEFIIMTVLDEIGPSFPDETVKNVSELIDHKEPGVALDVLCSQIFEYGLNLSCINRANLKEAARLMSIPLSQLDGLNGSGF